MPNNNLTKQGEETRRRILEFILSYIERHKFPPTIREIGGAVGLKRASTIYRQLEKLEEEGKIERVSETARGIRIPDSVWVSRLVEYRCLYPFGCMKTSKRAGTCRIHGTELVPFVTLRE